MTSPSLKSRQSIMWASASPSSSSSNPKMGTSPIMVTVVDMKRTRVWKELTAKNSRDSLIEVRLPEGKYVLAALIVCLPPRRPCRLVILGIKHHIPASAFAFTLGGEGGMIAEREMDQTALAR